MNTARSVKSGNVQVEFRDRDHGSDRRRYRKAFWKLYLFKLGFDIVFIQLEEGLK